MEYFGRRDSQLKIRGHRIELGEIEAKLKLYPKIENCLVTIMDFLTDPNQRQASHLNRIVVYYKAKRKSWFQKLLSRDIKISPTEMHAYLQNLLPEYMLPGSYVELEAIPMTPHGKIDKQRLPIPNKEQIVYHQRTRKPLDSLELQLQNLWQDILIASNCKQDNFFQVGGNSIAAVQLVSSINQHFQLDLPVAWLLENNTIESQAKSLRLSATLAFNPIICLNKNNSNNSVNQNNNLLKNLFLIHPGLTGAEVYSEFAGFFKEGISVFALDSHNLNSGRDFIETIEELASYYLSEIQKIQPKGPYYLGGWSLGGMIAYEMAARLHSEQQSVAGLYLLDTHIYTHDFLNSIFASISFENLLNELPQDHVRYLKSLPEQRMDRILASLKNDVKLLLDYEIKPWHDKLVLFKTTQTTSLNMGLTEVAFNGWKNYAKDVERILLDSTHFGLLETKQLEKIANHIEQDMKK